MNRRAVHFNYELAANVQDMAIPHSSAGDLARKKDKNNSPKSLKNKSSSHSSGGAGAAGNNALQASAASLGPSDGYDQKGVLRISAPFLNNPLVQHLN